MCSVTVWTKTLENLVNKLPLSLGTVLCPWVGRAYFWHLLLWIMLIRWHNTDLGYWFWSLMILVFSWFFGCTKMSWVCVVPRLGIEKALLLNNKILHLLFRPFGEEPEVFSSGSPKQNICLLHQAHSVLSLLCNFQANLLISSTICLLLLCI